MDVPIVDQIRRSVGSSPQQIDFGSVDWAVSEGNPEGAEQTVGLAVFDPGKGNVEHIHPNCEEVLYVLEGEMEHDLGEESVRLGPGDLIVIPRNARHCVRNVGHAPARVLISFSSPDRQFVPVD
jgi:quercetin dioxygenase-like cupin family protein